MEVSVTVTLKLPLTVAVGAGAAEKINAVENSAVTIFFI
jgi:hypothetical protein